MATWQENIKKSLEPFGTVLANEGAVIIMFREPLTKNQASQVRNAIPLWMWFMYRLNWEYTEECPYDGPNMRFWRR